MTRRGGPLSPHEAELWNRVAKTVEPLEATPPAASKTAANAKAAPASAKAARASANIFNHKPAPEKPTRQDFADLLNPAASGGQDKASAPQTAPKSPVVPARRGGLDGHWDRRFVRGRIEPDITVDLHGHTLASAYTRLDQSLALAIGGGFRVILLITGKPRDENAKDARGNRRGAIRAAVADWLAASRHASSIAAVRNAHPKHGGSGALYIVLKR